jgi:hypothetical protein
LLFQALENERPRWPLEMLVGMATGIVGYFTITTEPPVWFLIAACSAA